jgi:hypothetical protein
MTGDWTTLSRPWVMILHSIQVGGGASNEQHVVVDIVPGGSTNLRMSINQVIIHETTMRIITQGRDRVLHR